MPDRDPASLLDIAVAAGRIGEFIAGADAESFRRDVKTQSAVVFQLLIIGEATKRLSAEVRDRLPAVPWSDIARMRDRMIHHYEGIDVDEVWRTASQDVPRLLEALEPLLPGGE